MTDELSHKERKKNVLGAVLAALVVLLVGAAFAIGLLSAQRADVATANASTLATQIQDQCAKGPFLVNQRDLCQKADRVAQDPANPVPGPQGPQGEKGSPGSNGADSTVPGPSGKAGGDGKDSTAPGPEGAAGSPGPPGADGEDSTIAGPAGTDGKDGKSIAGASGKDGTAGKDSTIPGPSGPAGPAGKDGTNGKDSTVPGPAGPAGEPGATGKTGISITSVKCVGTGDASNWVIQYSDGTSQSSDGPCRLAIATQPAQPTSSATP